MGEGVSFLAGKAQGFFQALALAMIPFSTKQKTGK